MADARTYLFVPGNRPERFAKALDAGPDRVVLDLEDAVGPGDKASARAAIGSWLRERPDVRVRCVVRINDDATPWFAQDLAWLAEARPVGVMLPKTERPEQVIRLHPVLDDDGYVLPLVETARGLLAIEAIAAAPRVRRIAFGTIDYAVDLDLSGDERGLIEPSTRIALASRAAGIAAPVAGVTAEIGDEDRLLADLAFARAFGFGAKLCIHPRQVAPIHRALAPAATEVDWARRVIAAGEGAQGGAVQVDGKMVDRPVLLRAQAILVRAARA
jgi:citrate lyase subunit beta/citryl-CoA lyase